MPLLMQKLQLRPGREPSHFFRRSLHSPASAGDRIVCKGGSNGHTDRQAIQADKGRIFMQQAVNLGLGGRRTRRVESRAPGGSADLVPFGNNNLECHATSAPGPRPSRPSHHCVDDPCCVLDENRTGSYSSAFQLTYQSSGKLYKTRITQRTICIL